jgi:hypothetical protein
MSTPEFSETQQEAPKEWSISDGQFDPGKLVLDSDRFILNEKAAGSMPETARDRFLSAEAVTYAFEVCNQVSVLNDPALAETVHRAVASEAMAITDLSRTALDKLAGSSAKNLASAPVTQALELLFSEGLLTDPDIRIRGLAIIARLLDKEKSA